MHIEETNPRLEYFKNNPELAFREVPAGVTRWLGGRLKEVGPGHMVAEFVVREDMTNPMQVLHGGVAAMIMDEMMGIMVYLLGHEFAHTSVNLNCDFLSPAPVGARLVAASRVVRKGRNVVHCECVITGEQGKIIAKSASNLILTPIATPAGPGTQ